MRDEYRVQLFKKKLREVLPELSPGLRFWNSKGRCHLVIDTRWRYKHPEWVNEYCMSRLKASGIEYKVNRDKYGIDSMMGVPEAEREIDSISIPIDQEALPERKHKP